MKIQDGTGSSRELKIDVNNRAQITAIQESFADHAAESSNKYNINTGDITLTDATITSVLYVKNNETSDLVITALIYNLGNTASGTGDVKIDVIRNPTAGTIITDAVDVLVGTGEESNQNFGASKSLSIDAFKGDTADNDFTDGSVTISTRSAANTGRILISLGALLIPKGKSIGISYTPPASNTSQIVQFALSGYLLTSAVSGD